MNGKQKWLKKLPIDYNKIGMKNSDSFFQKVYEVTRLIPYGRVTSYGAIAKYLGSAQSA